VKFKGRYSSDTTEHVSDEIPTPISAIASRPLFKDAPGLYKGNVVYSVSYVVSGLTYSGGIICTSKLIYVTNTPIEILEMLERVFKLETIKIDPNHQKVTVKVTDIKLHDQMVPVPKSILYDGTTGTLINVN
jgi:hypothetical protein